MAFYDVFDATIHSCSVGGFNGDYGGGLVWSSRLVTFGGYSEVQKILCMTSSLPTKLSKPIKMGFKKTWRGKWNSTNKKSILLFLLLHSQFNATSIQIHHFLENNSSVVSKVQNEHEFGINIIMEFTRKKKRAYYCNQSNYAWKACVRKT